MCEKQRRKREVTREKQRRKRERGNEREREGKKREETERQRETNREWERRTWPRVIEKRCQMRDNEQGVSHGTQRGKQKDDEEKGVTPDSRLLRGKRN